MANACPDCGGVGYGRLDPGYGHRGTDPCPTCVETAKAEEVELGPPPSGSVTTPSNRTVVFVDGPGKSGADEAGMSAEEAVAAGIFSAEELAGQEAADAAAQAAETASVTVEEE